MSVSEALNPTTCMAAISLCMYCKMLFSVGSSLLETSSPPLNRFHIAVLKTPFVAEMNQGVLSTLSGVLYVVFIRLFIRQILSPRQRLARNRLKLYRCVVEMKMKSSKTACKTCYKLSPNQVDTVLPSDNRAASSLRL